MKGATRAFDNYISMSGLFTIVKVRGRLQSYNEDPEWYQHPPGYRGRQGERGGACARWDHAAVTFLLTLPQGGRLRLLVARNGLLIGEVAKV
jgi:hypothetical protein